MSQLLDHVRNTMRVQHYSYTTEKTYIYWIKQYIFFMAFVTLPRWERMN